MSKYFMYDTSLGGIEQLMMLAPNFPSRRSGIVINNHFNFEGDIKTCNSCGSNIKSRCNACDCIYLKTRLNNDEIRYTDLLKDCFGRIKNYALKGRLKLLSNSFTGELFLNHNHKERFYNIHHKQGIDIEDRTPNYLAVLFLLTADEVLWNISEHAVCVNGFDFSHMHL